MDAHGRASPQTKRNARSSAPRERNAHENSKTKSYHSKQRSHYFHKRYRSESEQASTEIFYPPVGNDVSNRPKGVRRSRHSTRKSSPPKISCDYYDTTGNRIQEQGQEWHPGNDRNISSPSIQSENSSSRSQSFLRGPKLKPKKYKRYPSNEFSSKKHSVSSRNTLCIKLLDDSKENDYQKWKRKGVCEPKKKILKGTKRKGAERIEQKVKKLMVKKVQTTKPQIKSSATSPIEFGNLSPISDSRLRTCSARSRILESVSEESRETYSCLSNEIIKREANLLAWRYPTQFKSTSSSEHLSTGSVHDKKYNIALSKSNPELKDLLSRNYSLDFTENQAKLQHELNPFQSPILPLFSCQSDSQDSEVPSVVDCSQESDLKRNHRGKRLCQSALHPKRTSSVITVSTMHCASKNLSCSPSGSGSRTRLVSRATCTNQSGYQGAYLSLSPSAHCPTNRRITYARPRRFHLASTTATHLGHAPHSFTPRTFNFLRASQHVRNRHAYCPDDVYTSHPCLPDFDIEKCDRYTDAGTQCNIAQRTCFGTQTRSSSTCVNQPSYAPRTTSYLCDRQTSCTRIPSSPYIAISSPSTRTCESRGTGAWLARIPCREGAKKSACLGTLGTPASVEARSIHDLGALLWRGSACGSRFQTVGINAVGSGCGSRFRTVGINAVGSGCGSRFRTVGINAVGSGCGSRFRTVGINAVGSGCGSRFQTVGINAVGSGCGSRFRTVGINAVGSGCGASFRTVPVTVIGGTGCSTSGIVYGSSCATTSTNRNPVCTTGYRSYSRTCGTSAGSGIRLKSCSVGVQSESRSATSCMDRYLKCTPGTNFIPASDVRGRNGPTWDCITQIWPPQWNVEPWATVPWEPAVKPWAMRDRDDFSMVDVQPCTYPQPERDCKHPWRKKMELIYKEMHEEQKQMSWMRRHIQGRSKQKQSSKGPRGAKKAGNQKSSGSTSTMKSSRGTAGSSSSKPKKK